MRNSVMFCDGSRQDLLAGKATKHKVIGAMQKGVKELKIQTLSQQKGCSTQETEIKLLLTYTSGDLSIGFDLKFKKQDTLAPYMSTACKVPLQFLTVATQCQLFILQFLLHPHQVNKIEFVSFVWLEFADFFWASSHCKAQTSN